MPITPRSYTRAGVGASTGGGGGGSAGLFNYYVITPSGGNAAVDIAANGVGTTTFMFRLVLDGTPVNISSPIWTGGSIVAGLKIWIFLDQDSTGNRALPTFDVGVSGAYSADVPNQQIDGTPSTRTAYQLTNHGTRWCLDFPTVGTGMAIT